MDLINRIPPPSSCWLDKKKVDPSYYCFLLPKNMSSASFANMAELNDTICFSTNELTHLSNPTADETRWASQTTTMPVSVASFCRSVAPQQTGDYCHYKMGYPSDRVTIWTMLESIFFYLHTSLIKQNEKLSTHLIPVIGIDVIGHRLHTSVR